MTHQPIWNFRPTVLQSGNYSIDPNDLLQRYLDDCDRAQRNADANLRESPSPSKSTIIPSREASSHTESDSVHLRTSQWNVHAFCARWLEGDETYDLKKHGKNVAETLIDTDSDIIILNEFCVDRKSNLHKSSNEQKRRKRNEERSHQTNIFSSILETYGYVIHEASCSYPTAIASRIPIQTWGEFPLDFKRSAVYIKAIVSGPKGPKVITVFGTHLEDSDVDNGSQRLKEVEMLISCVNEVQKEGNSNCLKIAGNYSNKPEKVQHDEDRILIVGDLNQQRENDYTDLEWVTLCANKKMRDSPSDDGVSTLLRNSQFRCNFDCLSSKAESDPPLKCNWLQHDPPPATHWTSTIVDYSYFKGSINLEGINIHPSKLSDHRLIVCDWVVH